MWRAAFDRPLGKGLYQAMGIGDQFEPALRSDARIAQVEGDDARLQPGTPFDLIDHPRDDLNIHWRTVNDHRKNARGTCAAVSS